MTQVTHSTEPCPRCKSADHVRPKLVLIDPEDPTRAGDVRRRACECHGDFSVNDLKPEFATSGASAQFMHGLYCELCGIGYVPEFMAKPPRPAFILAPEGWRRVHEDGTQGPLLERMSDDPDSAQ